MVVRRRFRDLETGLPAAYQLAIAAPPNEDGPPHLMALAVDLLRKEHSALPFADLTAKEQRLVQHARGAEQLPLWMSQLGALGLRYDERAMITKLRQVQSSRPARKEMHFGAIRRQQQLRSTPEH